ncbi:MAG TPA: hypothetical protein VH573_01760 [Mycobacteriales bacterium]|jgi:hypothetical protein
MPADPRQTARLRELHQDFAWKVNAAVAAGRLDLVDALCEEYADEAVRLIAGAPPGEPPPDLPPPPPPPPQPLQPRGRWRSLLTGAGSPRRRRVRG